MTTIQHHTAPTHGSFDITPLILHFGCKRGPDCPDNCLGIEPCDLHHDQWRVLCICMSRRSDGGLRALNDLYQNGQNVCSTIFQVINDQFVDGDDENDFLDLVFFCRPLSVHISRTFKVLAHMAYVRP